MRAKHIFDPCWSASVWLVWPATNATLDAFIKRQFGIDEKTKDGGFLGRSVEITDNGGDEISTVIALAGWRGSPRDHATLAHECLHAAHNILSRRGVPFDEHTDECYCYLMDSLVRRCLEILKSK